MNMDDWSEQGKVLGKFSSSYYHEVSDASAENLKTIVEKALTQPIG